MDIDYKCKLCKGTGLLNGTGFLGTKIPDVPLLIVFNCYGCKGTGKVDWITNIIGFNEDVFLSTRIITKGEYNEIKSR